MSAKAKQPKTKGEQDRELSSELEDSFPASDPPASVQPGAGVTGPEVARSPHRDRASRDETPAGVKKAPKRGSGDKNEGG